VPLERTGSSLEAHEFSGVFLESLNEWNNIRLKHKQSRGLTRVVMDIGYFSYFLFLYLLDKETQCDTYLNPCSEFILNFLDIIYSQMTPFRKQSFLLRLEPLSFRLCLIQ